MCREMQPWRWRLITPAQSGGYSRALGSGSLWELGWTSLACDVFPSLPHPPTPRSKQTFRNHTCYIQAIRWLRRHLWRPWQAACSFSSASGYMCCISFSLQRLGSESTSTGGLCRPPLHSRRPESTIPRLVTTLLPVLLLGKSMSRGRLGSFLEDWWCTQLHLWTYQTLRSISKCIVIFPLLLWDNVLNLGSSCLHLQNAGIAACATMGS